MTEAAKHTPDMAEALRPTLSKTAREEFIAAIEAERAVGSRSVATSMELLLEWHDKARAALAKAEGRQP